MRTVHARPCPECSISFTPDLRRQVCCSPECQKRRTQRKVVLYKAAEPWKITKRDRLGQRGSVAILFAGCLPGFLLIGGSVVDANLGAVMASRARSCASFSVLALVQSGRGAAWRIARANGCGLSGVSLVQGTTGPPYVPAQGSLTATVTWNHLLLPWSGSASVTVSATGGEPGVSLAQITSAGVTRPSVAGITNLH